MIFDLLNLSSYQKYRTTSALGILQVMLVMPQSKSNVLKPVCHVAKGAEFSVLNKPTQLSKWRRFQSHR